MVEHVQRRLTLMVIVTAFSAAYRADAVSPLTEAQLYSSCKAYREVPESELAQNCVRYVQGFLDGAVATDERVAMNVAEELERSETLTERAIRTRLGDRIRLRGPSYYAEYCVGDPVPVQEVIEHVIDEIEGPSKPSAGLARDVVYAALRRHYPCTE